MGADIRLSVHDSALGDVTVEVDSGPIAFDAALSPFTAQARAFAAAVRGEPHDFSGETALVWREWARERGASLWVTSFSGAYLGYLSPDKYYHEMGGGGHYNQNYEIGQMNWFGPNQEAYVTDLFHHVFDRLTPRT